MYTYRQWFFYYLIRMKNEDACICTCIRTYTWICTRTYTCTRTRTVITYRHVYITLSMAIMSRCTKRFEIRYSSGTMIPLTSLYIGRNILWLLQGWHRLVSHQIESPRMVFRLFDLLVDWHGSIYTKFK